MGEEEFWSSTYAKVMALYSIQVLEWNRTRDYFIAHFTALYISSKTSQGDSAPSPDEILSHQYPVRKPRGPKHDPDHGAKGDWRALRAALKGTTDEAKRKRTKLKPHGPKR